MITFTMLVTIWLGADTYKFNVFTSERFNGPNACSRSMEDLANIIRARVDAIPGSKAEIARACFTLETRIT